MFVVEAACRNERTHAVVQQNELEETKDTKSYVLFSIPAKSEQRTAIEPVVMAVLKSDTSTPMRRPMLCLKISQQFMCMGISSEEARIQIILLVQ